MTAEPLRELLEIYDKAVTELNEDINIATASNNTLVSAKAEVSKSKYKLDLIKEKIMCEKKLIDVAR